MVISWRGSLGSAHSGTSAGAIGSSSPAATSMPIIVPVIDFAIDHETCAASGS